MHALVSNQPVTYDKKTEAVLLYSDITVSVLAEDKIRTRCARSVQDSFGPKDGGAERSVSFWTFETNNKFATIIAAKGKAWNYSVAY